MADFFSFHLDFCVYRTSQSEGELVLAHTVCFWVWTLPIDEVLFARFEIA